MCVSVCVCVCGGGGGGSVVSTLIGSPHNLMHTILQDAVCSHSKDDGMEL